jgi:O-antigen ligase
MAKKKRSSTSRPAGSPAAAPAAADLSQGVAPAGNPGKPPKSRASAAVSRVLALPHEMASGDWTAIILALMMFFAPTLGVPHEEMLQDTLKSIIVAFAALGALLLLFWRQRNRRDALRWHFVMWLPLMLMAYALGSMVWSHTYLGGVEAVRWFVFAVLVWLAMNTLTRERVPHLAIGIHLGAVGACLWTALQFWFDFKYFPQGPNPASTFVNRNFIAEFAICTLPFSVFLLARARQSATISLMAFSTGFNIVAIMMTGTRSALTAMLILAIVLPVILYLYRKQLGFTQWDAGRRILAAGMLVATIIGLGVIPTGNPKLVEENTVEKRGITALQRGFARVLSMTKQEEYTEKSFSVRLVMWKATARMIKERPLSGVGAGAWEVDSPLYQAEGAQLETDYYVHNEILQVLAEYGLVGWLFLLLLLSYLSWSAWRTVRDRTPEGLAEAPLRALVLASLLALLVVSNAGFPWRMASTGALFALCLGMLAASDARLGLRGFAFGANRLPWRPGYSQVGAVTSMVCLVLAAYITQQAAECESKIVKAVKIALTVSQSGDYNNPKWDKPKREMLQLLREGVAINPHYRKITPMVADELAKWGDWNNAIWVWESVVSSRPYIVAIMSNIARGYAQTNQNDKAFPYLERVKKLQPTAATVRSLEVILLSRQGKEPQALALTKKYFAENSYDYDLVNAGYVLAARAGDWPTAVQAMELRNKGWPAQAVDAYIKIGNIYASDYPLKSEAKALAAYKAAMAAAPEGQKEAVRKQVPAAYQPRL